MVHIFIVQKVGHTTIRNVRQFYVSRIKSGPILKVIEYNIPLIYSTSHHTVAVV